MERTAGKMEVEITIKVSFAFNSGCIFLSYFYPNLFSKGYKGFVNLIWVCWSETEFVHWLFWRAATTGEGIRTQEESEVLEFDEIDLIKFLRLFNFPFSRAVV